MNIEKILDALKRTNEAKIVVFGDYCLDKYLYSDPAEDDVSVETGMPAWQIYAKSIASGVGGTITNNLCALGANVICVGAIGDDGEGYEVMKALRERGADTSYMITDPDICTATYIKPMRKTENGWKEDIRLDFRNRSFGSERLWDALVESFKKALEKCDAAIVTDQFFERNTGVVSDSVREAVNKIAAENPEKPILVDSRAFAAEFKNMYVKCNNYELMKYCGMAGSPENFVDIKNGGEKLKSMTGRPVFITRNKDGIAVFENELVCVPAYPPKGEIDVCGAGDASNAGIALGLSLGLSCAEAAVIACAVSSVTIEQIGTTGTSTPTQASERAKAIFEMYLKQEEKL